MMIIKRLFLFRSSFHFFNLRHISSNKGRFRDKSSTNEVESRQTSDSLSQQIYGGRVRCKELSSLHDEYFVTSIINVFLSQGKVQHAEPLLNVYRREGHQFDIQVYNQIINGWAEQNNDIKATLLYETMLEDGIVPDFFVRSGRKCEVSRLIKEMQAKGYVMSHLPHQVPLSKDQLKILLELLESLKITPSKPPKKEIAHSRLVEPIYVYNRDITSTPQRTDFQLFDHQTLHSKIQSQLEIEQRGYERIKSIAKSSDTDNYRKKGEKATQTLNGLYSHWERVLTKAIAEELGQYEVCLKTMESNWFGQHHLPKHLPFLATLPPDKWAQIIIEEVITKLVSQPDGQPIFYLCRSVLGPAWRKYVIDQKQKRGIVDKVDEICRNYFSFILSPERQSSMWSREYWKDLEESNIDHCIPSWPFTVGVHVGSTLIDILLQTLKLPDDMTLDADNESAAAFEHVHEFENGKNIGYIRPHPSLYSLVKQLESKSAASSFRMEAYELPMLVPPRPWTEVIEGGYLLTPSSIVRCYDDTFQHQLLLEANENMTAIFDSLNYLGACPWRVNTRILDLVIDQFNKGGDESIDIPSTLDLPDIPTVPRDCDDETKKLMKWERKRAKKLHKENFSLRMDMLYKLSMSNHYRDCLFWLPHNMDFRSRVYPIPPHITHLSSDIGRSLIQFGIGYPLGKRGLEWLKIHLANLHGATSKQSLEERLKFTEEMLPEIFDSSDKPFEGNGWWRSADEPWQTLACCMELTSALRSGDPESYVSHTPVHQDGSCNGLQHYAAMGRDVYGAQQVNLVPSSVPANLYAEVASLVDKKRQKDAKNGDQLAQTLEGHVHRKVVKQTVMTVVYGVTWVGGRLQIEKQLKGNIPDDVLFKASSYLVGLVFESLKEMFSNARKIQDWLTTSARIISLAGHPVEWITPLGMPVVQPYHKSVSKQIKIPRLQTTSRLNNSDFSRPPNSVKQTMAMLPNFVHSLDSTHMMLTALHCQRAGIPFVAVHDSYWTHGAFVDEMNKICREQFIALHNEPILEDLASFFETKFGGLPYVDHGSKWTKGSPGKKTCVFKEDLPSRGDLKLDCIRDSTYFFS